jgi:hypothetical protein
MKNVLVASLLSSLLGCAQAPAPDGEVATQEEQFAGLDDSAGPPRTPGPLSIVYHDEAVIAASVDRIWDILTDLPRYSEWNPWVVDAEGKVEHGEIVWVDVILNNNKMRAKHVVLTVNPKTDFCWRDAGWNSAFVYGQRCRTLTPQADGTVLFQVDLLLDGLFSKVADLTEGPSMRSGMANETLALKQRAEAQP